MSDSVGKIGLELEIVSDITAQVSKVSNSLKSSLKKNLENTMSKSLNNITKETKSKLNGVSRTISNSISKTLNNTVKSLRDILKRISTTKISLPKPTKFISKNDTEVNTETKRRGPPIDYSVITSQIDNVTKTLDNTNARIEQQKSKLKQLKEEYDRCFNPSKKNKLEEKILKTEAGINKLIATSDRLGFKLSDLDAKLSKASSGMVNTGKSSSRLRNIFSGINNSSKVLSDRFKNLINNTNKTSNAIKNTRSNISIIARSMFTWGIMFPMILRGLQSMGTGLLNNLKTNEQFVNSLAQIKSNLMIAFTPIYNFILPAINALMSALSTVTQYIASFISAIFGKTFNQSKQATQGLIDAKEAMGAYGDSAKAAGKKAKDALGLAGIDEINTLGSSDDGADGGGGGASKVPQLVTPALDTTSVDSKMKALVDKVKGYLSIIFNPFKKAWESEGSGVVTQFKKAVEGTKDTFKHFFDTLKTPAVQSFMESLSKLGLKFVELGLFIYNEYILPLTNWFIDMTGPILSSIQPIIDKLREIIDWLMADGKPVLDVVIITLGSMAAAFLVVKGAISVFNTATKLIALITNPVGIAVAAIGAIIAIGVLLYKNWDVIKEKAKEVWDSIKNKFNEFKEWLGNIFLTDWSQKFGKLGDIMNGFFSFTKGIWDGVKRIFGGIIDFVAGVFTGNWERAWNGVKDIFGGIMGGLGGLIKSPLNAVISLVNSAIGGINSISVDIPDWIPMFGGSHFGLSIPKIPMLAKGGLIDSPTLAMIGETHKKEAVVPLEGDTKALSLIADKLMERLGGMNSTNSNNSDRPIEITLKVGDTVFGKKAIESINKITRQGGVCKLII
jgi:translation initiation factor 2B subunit (eIF-2B alpha/beta/delta family)